MARLFALAQALTHDYERFEALVEKAPGQSVQIPAENGGRPSRGTRFAP